MEQVLDPTLGEENGAIDYVQNVDVQSFNRQGKKEKLKISSFYSANSSDREAYMEEEPLPESKAKEIYR